MKRKKIDVSSFYMGTCSLGMFIIIFVPLVLGISNNDNTVKELLSYINKYEIAITLFGAIDGLFLWLTNYFLRDYFEVQNGTFKDLINKRNF